VVGSGDQLALQIRSQDTAGRRTIQRGEEYKDGWILKGLSPVTATLAKDDQVREIGLNPTGAVAPASPEGPLSTVTITLSAAEQARLQAAIDTHYWNGQSLPGLSLADTQTVVLADLTIRAALVAGFDKAAAPSSGGRMGQLPELLGRGPT